MNPIAWYLHQLAAHGLAVVLGIQAGALLATVCGVGAAWEAVDRQREKRQIRRDIRHLEMQINHPAVRAMYLDTPREEEL